MARQGRVEKRLTELNELAADASAPGAVKAVVRALGDASHLVVAKAARIAGNQVLEEAVPALAQAFARLVEGREKRDPGCEGKTAIAAALQAFGHAGDPVFLVGARHVQREAVWGGSVDTAAELRGVCGMGLARTNHPEAMATLTDLLADREPATRAAAAQALAWAARGEGALLLRLKLRLGDADVRVLGACFDAYLSLAPDTGLEVVAGFLEDADPAVAETAAMALGQSRLEPALAVLVRCCETCADAALRRAALLAIAMLRLESAFEFLLQRLLDPSPRVVEEAAGALRLHRHDQRIRERVERAAASRDDRALAELVLRTFVAD